METEHIYRHLWNYIPEIGPKSVQIIEQRSSSLQEAWHSVTKAELVEWFSEKRAAKMYPELQKQRLRTSPEAEQRMLSEEGIELISWHDDRYPKLLTEIASPPHILYVRGHLKNVMYGIAVVGTRKVSKYGRTMTEQLAYDLTTKGYAIISGLAMGIDSIAHQANLDAGGYTVAVLGGGVDDATISPRKNWNLAQRILSNGGAVMSEYPPGTVPRAAFFPQRNRIVSGMTRGTLVTEASLKSGALITARCALEENRDVFAVPGPVTQNGAGGVNQLIKEGAKLVECAVDVEEELAGVSPQSPEAQAESTSGVLPDMTETEQAIYEVLQVEPLPHDLIAARVNVDITEIISSLSMLELKGVVQAEGGVYRVV